MLSDEITKNYKQLLSSGPREFKKSLQDWNFENGLLLHKGKVYIPHSEDEQLRRRIVQISQTYTYLLVSWFGESV